MSTFYNDSDGDSVEDAIKQTDDEGYLDNTQDEIGICPNCGWLNCICELQEDTPEDRYLDKRLSDREDFHSDDSRFDIFDEPYYPEY